MTMITPSYLGETIEYSSLHACRSTLEDPTLSMPTPYYGVDGGVNQPVLAAMLKMLHDNGDIDRVPSVDDVLDMQFVETALKTLGPYKSS